MCAATAVWRESRVRLRRPKVETTNPNPTAARLKPRRGRGAQSNESGRFELHAYVPVDDGWGDEAPPPRLATTLTFERAKTIITRNNSPDISFDRSINPYRGCEHGCVYCFARPTHAYMGLSPGLDFEPSFSPKPTRQVCSNANSPPRPISRGPSQSAPTPILISRSSASIGLCARSSKFWRAPIIRSASSPNLRWCCAISICLRRWPRKASSRSRCR